MENKAAFEENMEKLGKLVAELERGDIPLDRAVELYGDGVKLSAECRKQLAEAELRISGDLPTEEKI